MKTSRFRKSNRRGCETTATAAGRFRPSPGCIIGSARLFVRRKFERVEFRAAERFVLCAAARRRGIIAWSCRGRSKHLAIRARGFDGIHWLRAIEGSRAAPPSPAAIRPIEVEHRLIEAGVANDADPAATARAIEETRRSAR